MKNTLKNTGSAMILLFGIIFFSSCSPKFYSPNTQNVPLLQEKGDISLNALSNGDIYEVQGAYAAGENFGIMVNGALFVPTSESSGNGGSGKLAELGLGYFKPLGERFVFETYGLLGAGVMENHFPYSVEEHPESTGTLDANVFRFGLQPAIGFKSRFFTMAFSSRICALNYSNIRGSLFYASVNQADYLSSHNTSLLIEPAITLRMGVEKIKFQIQLIRSINATTPDFPQDKALLTVGLNLNLN